jgi:hypothetical protein
VTPVLAGVSILFVYGLASKIMANAARVLKLRTADIFYLLSRMSLR